MFLIALFPSPCLPALISVTIPLLLPPPLPHHYPHHYPMSTCTYTYNNTPTTLTCTNITDIISVTLPPLPHIHPHCLTFTPYCPMFTPPTPHIHPYCPMFTHHCPMFTPTAHVHPLLPQVHPPLTPHSCPPTPHAVYEPVVDEYEKIKNTCELEKSCRTMAEQFAAEVCKSQGHGVLYYRCHVILIDLCIVVVIQ